MATQWQAMWDVSRGGLTGAVLFEEQAAHALAAWRAGRFELPDYYLVLAGPDAGGTDFYLGPLHAARPHRVVVAAATTTATTATTTATTATATEPEQAARVRDALRSLRPGPWWPPLDEVLDTARRLFAGGLAEAGTTLASGTR